MKNLFNLSNEEICEFLLNNKKAVALELGSEEDVLENNPDNKFINRVIYEDKTMKIIYSFLKIKEDDIIEQFFIYSTWWGKIKNSHLSLEGFTGKSQRRCGVINIDDLKTWNSGTNHSINNHNAEVKIEVTDFASLVLFCQKKYKKSPSYEVSEVISLSPNPWVEIKIFMPDGTEHCYEGTSKKDAANKFAVEFFKKE